MGSLLQADLYPTDEIYEAIFNFSKTEPRSEKYEMLGYDSQNFIQLSGSLSINMVTVVTYASTLALASFLACKLYKLEFARYVGCRIPETSTIANLVSIFIQGYLELSIQ